MRYKLLSYTHNIATIFIFLLFLLFGWIFNNVTGWGIFYSLLIFLIIEAIQLLAPLHSLKSSTHDQFAYAGEEESITLGFKSKHHLFVPKFTVQIFQNRILFGEGVVYSHDFKEPKQVQLRLYGIPRGYYPKNTLLFLANDYFLMWEKMIISRQKMNIYVLPQRLPKQGKILARSVEKIIHRPTKDAELSSFEFKNYRDYENADSLKSIDWNKTAKTGNLTVRVNYPEQDPRNVLVFWGEENALFELAISIFNSMYDQLDSTKFDAIYLIGQNSFVGREIDKKWLSFIRPFSEPDYSFIVPIKDKNVYLFSAGNCPSLKKTISILNQHNKIIRINLKSQSLVTITSQHHQRSIHLGDGHER